MSGRLPDGFWARVTKTETCWLWTGRLKRGYGVYTRGHINRSAHRLAYEEAVGPIPEGLTLDHLCRNKACVNPEHLEPVTAGENIRRNPLALATLEAQRTHCPQGHEYAGENLYIHDGKRHCRACKTERARAWRLARVAGTRSV